MAPENRARVVKLMQLSSSANNHEALAALRAAQKILDDHRLSWEDFLALSVIQSAPRSVFW